MGDYVINHGWDFRWPGGTTAPYAIKPDGSTIDFDVRDNVIYLKPNDVMAAVGVVVDGDAMPAVKRRHSRKGPPREGDEAVMPPGGVEPLPEPPVAAPLGFSGWSRGERPGGGSCLRSHEV